VFCMLLLHLKHQSRDLFSFLQLQILCFSNLFTCQKPVTVHSSHRATF